MTTIDSPTSATRPTPGRRLAAATLLAAALALGAASAVPAIAGAAPPVTTTPQPPNSGSGPVPAHKKAPPQPVMCTHTGADGSINFFLPGEIDGGEACGADGQWHLLAKD